jgi:hypothetical protein
MKEEARKKRNEDRVAELYPTFGKRIKAVINDLEKQGLRPRIQDAWRSPEKQLEAFNSGHSKLKYGFHNVTGKDGTKEALAVDLLDDDSPANEGQNICSVLRLPLKTRTSQQAFVGALRRSSAQLSTQRLQLKIGKHL